MTNALAEKTFASSSAAETEVLGEHLARALIGGTLVTLSGELGAGKTVFVRGVARGLNAPSDTVVTSPTYVIQHVYIGGRLTLYHIDAYRIAGGGGEFEASGLLECLDDANGIVCMEWPERLDGLPFPADRISVELEHDGPRQRRVIFKATGPRSANIINAF